MQYPSVEKVLIDKNHKEASALAYGEALKSLGFEFLPRESYGISPDTPFMVILSRKHNVGIGITYIEYVKGIRFEFEKEDPVLGISKMGLSIIEEDERGYLKTQPRFEFGARLMSGVDMAVKGNINEDGSLTSVHIKYKPNRRKSVDAFYQNQDGEISIGEFIRPNDVESLLKRDNLLVESGSFVKK